MERSLFEIKDLHVAAGEHQILKGLSLSVGKGEVHAIMGPNGSGKSTLANTLLGNPDYQITSGSILFHGEDITDWSTDIRAKAGIFLAFQYPQEIAGVSVIQFLRQAVSARKAADGKGIAVRAIFLHRCSRGKYHARERG